MMPGREYQAQPYRFGFNGQENSYEIKGFGNSYTAGFWEYDTRLGRRWNLDPKPVTGVSEYAGFMNNPVWLSDPLGDTSVVGAGGAYGLEIDEKANKLEFYGAQSYNLVGCNTQAPVNAGQLRAFTNFLGRFSATWSDKDGPVTFIGYKNEKGQTIDEAILSFKRIEALRNANIARDFFNFVESTYEQSQTDPVGYVNSLMITHFTLYTPGTGGILGGRPYNPSFVTQESMSGLGALKFTSKIATNAKGTPYPLVFVQGYGKVPFPAAPYAPNNSQLLRPEFTPALKKEFKAWWIGQGRVWPTAPEGSMINIHHIKPLSKGGTNAFDNLVPLIHPGEHQPFTNWWRGF